MIQDGDTSVNEKVRSLGISFTGYGVKVFPIDDLKKPAEEKTYI